MKPETTIYNGRNYAINPFTVPDFNDNLLEPAYQFYSTEPAITYNIETSLIDGENPMNYTLNQNDKDLKNILTELKIMNGKKREANVISVVSKVATAQPVFIPENREFEDAVIQTEKQPRRDKGKKRLPYLPRYRDSLVPTMNASDPMKTPQNTPMDWDFKLPESAVVLRNPIVNQVLVPDIQPMDIIMDDQMGSPSSVSSKGKGKAKVLLPAQDGLFEYDDLVEYGDFSDPDKSKSPKRFPQRLYNSDPDEASTSKQIQGVGRKQIAYSPRGQKNKRTPKSQALEPLPKKTEAVNPKVDLDIIQGMIYTPGTVEVSKKGKDRNAKKKGMLKNMREQQEK